jgi:intein/homing endonuclease
MNLLAVSEILHKANIWHKIEKDFICTRRTRTKIPNINDKIAYLAGVVTGDGSLTICKRKKGGYCYKINIVGQKLDMENLVRLTKEVFSYEPKVFKDKRKQNCYFINIYNAALFAYFNKLGFLPGKKRNIRVPPIIADDPSLFKRYMLGLIDTDGYIHNKTVHLKQRDENFLKQLVILLKRHFNIESNPPKVNLTAGKPYYYIRFPNKLQHDFNKQKF